MTDTGRLLGLKGLNEDSKNCLLLNEYSRRMSRGSRDGACRRQDAYHAHHLLVNLKYDDIVHKDEDTIAHSRIRYKSSGEGQSAVKNRTGASLDFSSSRHAVYFC